MAKPGVLIIDGHIQALSLARSLGEQGIPVYIADKNLSVAGFSRYVKKHFPAPEYQGEEFIEFLIYLAEKENLRGWTIITTDDSITENISANKSRLSEFYKLIAPNPDVMSSIVNKRKLLGIGKSIGISVPKIYDGIGENFDDFDLHFPVILKGDYGRKFYMHHRTKAIVFNDLDGLRTGVSKYRTSDKKLSYFIQELLPVSRSTRVISFTAFSIEGEIKSYWVGEKVREHPPTLGTATMSRSCIVPEILHDAKALLNALKYTGVSEIEFLKIEDDDKYYLIEMNPRTWLWVSLAKKCGIDYAPMIYNYLNGIENQYPQTYKDGVYWVNPVTDIPYSIKGILSGIYTLSEVLKSYFKVKDFSVFKISDPLPGIMMVILLPYIAKKR